MGDFDKSLDDIIKQRQFGVKRNAVDVKRKAGITMLAGNQFRSGKANQGRKFAGAKQLIKNRGLRLAQKPQTIQDARQKLQRLKIKDARETLVQKGRLIDARQKLNEKSKIKDAREKLNNLARAQNQSSAMKTTNQPAKPSLITRTVSNSDGRLQPTRLMSNNNTISGEYRNIGKQVVLTDGGLTVIARSSLNTQNNSFNQPSSVFSRTVDSLTKEAYSQSNNLKRSSNSLTNKRQLSSDESEEDYYNEKFISPPKKVFTIPVESPDINRGISTSLQSRLGKQIGGQQGYRLIVTNLHPLVSDRDLEDLFGDVGPIYGVQILQVGVAEVIYQRLADAQKSVAIYNKRELDGKPMSVKLVNTVKSPQNPVPSKYVGSVFNTGTLRSDHVQEVSAKSRITPDVGLFHKALFQSGSLPAAARPHAAFTVTM